MRSFLNVNRATCTEILTVAGFNYGIKEEENADGTNNIYFDDNREADKFAKLRLKVECSLYSLYDLAYRAYSGTSFSPEKRAIDFITSYSKELDEDLSGIIEASGEEEAARYKENYMKHIGAWLSAKSRCLSSMITGSANFPTRRNEKANNAERKRSEEFTDWRERALKSISKRVEAAKPQGQKDNERFQQISKSIISSAAVIAGIDNGTERGYSRALFVNSISGKIKTLANNGEIALVNKCLELIRELNAQAAKPIISAKHGIWQLEHKAEAARELAQDTANRESKEMEFEGGKIIFNYQANRLQIVFDEKPDADTRNMLKKNGYKWAPSAGVWQRQLTQNAKYCLRFLTLPLAEAAI